MAPINLGNVVGVIASTTEPLKKYIWWFHIQNALYPDEGILKKYDATTSTWVTAEDSFWMGAITGYNTSAPPGSPTAGDTYIIAASGTSGAFVGNEKKVAVWLGHSWIFISPKAGTRAGSKTVSATTYFYSGSAWSTVSGGGSSYTFENGLVESAGVVKWVGPLTEDTDFDSDGYEFNFHVSGTRAMAIDLRSLYDSAGVRSINWSSRVATDSLNVQSIRWEDRALANAGDTAFTIRWNTMQLSDSGDDVTVDWGDKKLYNSGSFIILDWENSYLNDAVGNPMFKEHSAYATTGELTADFENGRLYDYTGNVAVSWVENGAEGQLLIDGDLSVDWANRQLLNTAEVLVLDWSAGAMYRSDTSISVDWESSALYSPGAVISVAWEDHILWNQDQLDYIEYSGDDGSHILILESVTKAFLPPRMTSSQKNAIPTPEVGAVVIDTTLGKMCVYGSTGWETVTSV